MDISETLAPKSDQQGFDDYLTGPRTVTVESVDVVKGEQPVIVELVEYPGRPFKPNKSMRRVLAKAWGPDSDAWIGRRLTLFGNPAVIWAGKPTGGVEISHMSHLEKPLTMPLTASKGKRKNFTVKPLVEQAPTVPATSAGAIPAEVIATTEKAKADGNLPEYAEYLKGQNAPAYVLEYVNQQMENK